MRDDFDSMVADRFKVLDDVPVPDNWLRVQLKVLDNSHGADTSSPVQVTEEVATVIDVKTTDPTEPRQKRPMRVGVAGILAAAAVVAIVLVVIRDADDVTPADEPSSTVTVPSTTPPRALPDGLEPSMLANVVPGTYYVDEVDGTPTARISFTVGDGWVTFSPYGPSNNIWQTDIGHITFSRADRVRVFSDACHWSDGYYPGPVATLDDFVAALSEQGGWVDVTGPSDISIDGYAGKAIQRTAPAELSDCSTMPSNYFPRVRPAQGGPFPVLRSWQNEPANPANPAGDLYEPGEVETLWILDIDGTVVVINTRLWPSVTTGARALAGPSVVARAEFAAVLDSIRIERA